MRHLIGLALAGFAIAGCGNGDDPALDSYQGIVELDERQVAFEVPGRLLQVALREGDVVEPGSLIGRLDDTLAKLQLDAAAAAARAAQARVDLLYAGTRKEEVRAAFAQLKEARAAAAYAYGELNRARGLVESGAGSTEQLDARAAAHAQAQARVEQLEQQLKAKELGPRAEEIRAAEAQAEQAAAAERHAAELVRRHVLKATQGGEVLHLPVERGEQLAAGSPIAVLADPTQPFVDVFVPQAELARFRVGGAVSVRTDGLGNGVPGAPLAGAIEHIARTTEFTPRFLFSERERPHLVVRVRIRIQDPEQRVRAGIPAFVTLAE
ncbi:MAG: HlyD family secretion protein [Planctomycetota bacterium]|jgi:HlyD family secretion protein